MVVMARFSLCYGCCVLLSTSEVRAEVALSNWDGDPRDDRHFNSDPHWCRIRGHHHCYGVSLCFVLCHSVRFI